MNSRRLVLATTNANKVREIRAILEGVPVDLIGLAIAPPEETGATFSANARQKALYYANATGAPVVAEDSGLEIDALGGAPGVQSARFGGDDTSYPEKFALIYDELRRAGATTSSARFVCAVALIENGEVRFEAQGTVEGRIAEHPAGTAGFGYDPIFYYPPYNRTLAEVTPAEKAAVSHRGVAFRQLQAFLTTDDRWTSTR
jgi:XTP/dITP diphosphohydrolase